MNFHPSLNNHTNFKIKIFWDCNMYAIQILRVYIFFYNMDTLYHIVQC